jgi:hypothetical protein
MDVAISFFSQFYDWLAAFAGGALAGRIAWSQIFAGLWFYTKNILLALDQFGNALIGGDPDETISRRAGRARNRGERWGCIFCKLLEKIDPRHCGRSVTGDDPHEGANSVAQMLSRWRRGEPATWVPGS